jgi:tRNA threonylcarbamoyladenosine biosynthesis protein TsaB
VGDVVNILAIETATPACAIALRHSSGEERLLAVESELHHTEALVPGIQSLLIDLELQPRDVDRVVVDRGPGLFTGLRVGIATAIGFAFGVNAELVGVTSLELLAYGAHRSGLKGSLEACVDGRRGEIFHQRFLLGDVVMPGGEPAVSKPKEFVDSLAAQGDSLTFTGDGVARYDSVFRTIGNATFFDQRVPPPREALNIGTLRSPVSEIIPLYLRESDAVANFTTRARRP